MLTTTRNIDELPLSVVSDDLLAVQPVAFAGDPLSGNSYLIAGRDSAGNILCLRGIGFDAIAGVVQEDELRAQDLIYHLDPPQVTLGSYADFTRQGRAMHRSLYDVFDELDVQGF